MHTTAIYLRKIWHELSIRYSDNDKTIDELWLEIENSYTSKDRHYHNLNHLEYMIGKAFDCENHINGFDAILLSIFYHDIIYNIQSTDNELKSAELAAERLKKLGMSDEIIASCKEQILATKDHKVNNKMDTDFLLDIDLAILGENCEKYTEYTKKIRMEYADFSDLVYNNGRKLVLQHFLDMDKIFKTQHFFNKLEQQARENLKTEMQELS